MGHGDSLGFHGMIFREFVVDYLGIVNVAHSAFHTINIIIIDVATIYN